jgi:hypothetical protein
MSSTIKNILAQQQSIDAIRSVVGEIPKMKVLMAIIDSGKLTNTESCLVYDFAFGFVYCFQFQIDQIHREIIHVPDWIIPHLRDTRPTGDFKTGSDPLKIAGDDAIQLFIRSKIEERRRSFTVEWYKEEVEITAAPSYAPKRSYRTHRKTMVENIKYADLTDIFMENVDKHLVPGHFPIFTRMNFLKTSSITGETVCEKYLEVEMEDDEDSPSRMYFGPLPWKSSEIDTLIKWIEDGLLIFHLLIFRAEIPKGKKPKLVQVSFVHRPGKPRKSLPSTFRKFINSKQSMINVYESIHFFKWNQL